MRNFKYIFIIGLMCFIIWFVCAWPIGFNLCPKEKITKKDCEDNCYSQPNKMEDVEVEVMRDGQLYIIKAKEVYLK